MTSEALAHLKEVKVSILTDMLLADLREGFVIGQRIRARELSELTGVPESDVLGMAAQIAIVTRMGSVLP